MNQNQLHRQTNTTKMRKTRKSLSTRTMMMIAIFAITVFHFANVAFHELSNAERGKFSRIGQQQSSKTENRISVSESPIKGNVTHYKLVNDTRYHYEFHFEYHRNSTNNDPRLMILINGNARTCKDYWDFSVGRRILATLHSSRFLILVICAKKQTYDINTPVQNNSDVRWIYSSLQKWMNEVYYKQFQRYPRLYIHGISRGSRFAALLSRVLPIQAQIFTISPESSHSLHTHSDYPIDLQTRLQLDSVFANWFYFDFCYNNTKTKREISELCPFQNERYNYQPVPPTYFIHLANDPFINATDYTSLIDPLRKDAFRLGGKVLNHTEAVKFHILSPLNATPTYMQETFDIWRSKPHASAIFYQHYINRQVYTSSNNTRQTCRCLPTDFRYFELYPNITRTWSTKKQDEYKDYVNDIKKYKHYFCEDVCGDLYAVHGMSSRHLDKILQWVNTIDSRRHTSYIDDYLTRPLRIWMYEKNSIVTNTSYFSSNEPNYANVSKSFQMYSPEYYIQDYFQQLKASNTYSRHNFQWAENPLLADYFIIPSDLSYYYFYSDVNKLQKVVFKNLVHQLNIDYFEILLKNIRTIFPYWTMAKQADLMGSNHILPIVNGRNMGIFYDYTQNILKNVIQIVFTGLRQDLLPPNTPSPRDHRGTPIVYRHGYDVVIPQFTRLKPNKSVPRNLSVIAKSKKRLFFFSGSLGRATTPKSARSLLWAALQDINQNHTYSKTTEIQGKQFDTMTIIANQLKYDDYIESIQSTVFFLCPEAFFPWSPRYYEAIQIGAIPFILADNVVLPFERFIDWPSFSAKINVSSIENITKYVHQIDNFEQYIKQKLTNALPYKDAFTWPYSIVEENHQNKHVFLPDEDRNGSTKNAFHYLSLELRCRRLEQLYGLTPGKFSMKSIGVRRQTCTAHPTICPCHNEQRSVAFREYL